jgi:hypothetical protein
MTDEITVSWTVFIPGLIAPPGDKRTSSVQRFAPNLVQSPAAMPHLCARAYPATPAKYRERHVKLFYYMQLPCCPALSHMLA